MVVIGITGGSGCGKSNVSGYLAANGLYHMDCDLIARKVVEPGSACLKELSSCFGKEILNDDGSLNRKKLANLAFSSEENTNKLNDITLKYIIDYINNTLVELEKMGEKAVLLDGATLIESGLDKICDINIAVTAPKEERIKHIIARDSLTTEEALRRINAQKADSFYTANADYIIVNDSTLDSLCEKTNDIYNKILKTEEWNEG